VELHATLWTRILRTCLLVVLGHQQAGVGLYASASMPISTTATEAEAARQPAFLRGSLASVRGLSLVNNHEALAEELQKNYGLGVEGHRAALSRQ